MEVKSQESRRNLIRAIRSSTPPHNLFLDGDALALDIRHKNDLNYDSSAVAF
jgi:hypothetical protein